MGRLEILQKNRQWRKTKSILRVLFVFISFILICFNYSKIEKLIFVKDEAVIEQQLPVIDEIKKEVLGCNDIVGRYKRVKNRKAQVLQIFDIGSTEEKCLFEVWLEHDKSKRNEVRLSLHEKQIELFEEKFDVTLDGKRIVLININDNQDVFKKD